MEFWEFLIQKEDDRSWLPLESPSVEILEGRYRMVARSSWVNAVTEIRVTHLATAEIPPVRRVRKRSSRTNKDGLVVIIPFTRLLPGVWEFRCTSDLMADMMGEGWQRTVQLQILPLQIDTADDWDIDWPGDASGEESTESALVDSASEAKSESKTSERETAAQVEPFAPALVLEGSVSEVDAEPIAVEPEQQNVDVLIGTEMVAEASSSSAVSTLTEAAPSETAPVEVDSPASLEADSFQPLIPVALTATSEDEVVDSEENSGQDAAPQTNEPLLRLSLDQETYVVQSDQTLVLTGRVESTAEPLDDFPVPLAALQVCLYDPQTSEALLDQSHSLADQVPPFPFSCEISLPATYETYLLLGELILYGAAAEGTAVLATQSFSVTTDLHELLEAIANDFSDSDLLPPLDAVTPEPSKLGSAADLAALEPLSVDHSPQFQTATPKPLPPQLHPPDTNKVAKPLQLPSFVNTARSTAADESAAAAETTLEEEFSPASIEADNTPEAEEAAAPDEPIASDAVLDEAAALSTAQLSEASSEQSFDRTSDQQTADEPTVEVSQPAAEQPSFSEVNPSEALPEAPVRAVADSPVASIKESNNDIGDDIVSPEWDRTASGIFKWQRQTEDPAVESLTSPEDVAFRALNLQSRFWERLQALVADTELSTWLSSFQPSNESTLLQQPLAAQWQSNGSAITRSKDRAIGMDARLASREIVVEDEPSSSSDSSHQNGSTPPPEVFPAAGLVLSEDEPVPLPELDVPVGELTSGKPVNVTVKLPTLLPRIFVKLWVQDRQSRSLLDGPRWLVDFVPDGFGNQLARTQLIVPFGCLEIQFEAIAVEMVTQLESDKVTTIRKVVPPDLSSFSLDDLNI